MKIKEQKKKIIHGHDMFIKYISSLKSKQLKKKTIIEIGTTREIHNSQDSSMAFSIFFIGISRPNPGDGFKF